MSYVICLQALPESDRFDQHMKSKQCCVPKSNLEAREENLNLHTKVVNVSNTTVGNDPKLYVLGDDIFASNNGFD